MSGREPIEWSDLVAFLSLTKSSLTPWEIEIIEDLDDLYRAATTSSGAVDEQWGFISTTGNRPPERSS